MEYVADIDARCRVEDRQGEQSTFGGSDNEVQKKKSEPTFRSRQNKAKLMIISLLPTRAEGQTIFR